MKFSLLAAMRFLALATLTVISATPCLAQSVPAGPAINGFRSAKFAMTQAQVRRAIAADFSASASAVTEAENPLQRTTVLTVAVPNLVPNGGTAVVNYVLGYQSHKLIQISIVWAPAFDSKITPAVLAQDGESLQEYFATEGFPPERSTGNIPTPGGELLFRASDAAGNVVSLIISGNISKDKSDDKALLSPTDLTLTYATNPMNPDVFELPKGSF